MDEKTLKRFWSKVNKNGPVPGHRPEIGRCWVWTGSSDRQGYGRIKLMGRPALAHRVSFAQHGGPTDRCVLHACDNPACCNPSHLFAGTVADNNGDMRKKNRQARGHSASRAHLTDADVNLIRFLGACGSSGRQIGSWLGISGSTASAIIRRTTWGHI